MEWMKKRPVPRGLWKRVRRRRRKSDEEDWIPKVKS